MFVSGMTLEGLIGNGSIKITPFYKGNFSGDTYDLSLDGEFLVIRGDEVPFIDPSNLNIVGERSFANDFILQPGDFVLARSEEWLELPNNIMAMVSGKSSLARLGLQVESAYLLHPGHAGYIVLEIKNNNRVPFKLIKGMKIAQLAFMEMTDPVKNYAKNKKSTFGLQKKIELPEKLGFSE